jgi:hypothetical protein
MTGSIHTPLGPYLLDMIDFIEEKIREALQHTTSAKAALEEASGAIAPMKERLTKEENDPLIAALCFEIFYVDLKRMDKAQLNAFIERLQVARRLVARFTE